MRENAENQKQRYVEEQMCKNPIQLVQHTPSDGAPQTETLSSTSLEFNALRLHTIRQITGLRSDDVRHLCVRKCVVHTHNQLKNTSTPHLISLTDDLELGVGFGVVGVPIWVVVARLY